jgi:hypothetical protein
MSMKPVLLRLLGEFCSWLEETPLSQTIQSTTWLVPAVQTIHILVIAVVATSALMIDLRLIGVFGADQSLKAVSSRFLPFIWWPLLLLLATGIIMIIGEPARSLKNPVFQLKMGLLVSVLILTCIYQFLLRRRSVLGDLTTDLHIVGTSIAALSMLLWAGIIFAGRWIAYYS